MSAIQLPCDDCVISIFSEGASARVVITAVETDQEIGSFPVDLAVLASVADGFTFQVGADNTYLTVSNRNSRVVLSLVSPFAQPRRFCFESEEFRHALHKAFESHV